MARALSDINALYSVLVPTFVSVGAVFGCFLNLDFVLSFFRLGY